VKARLDRYGHVRDELDLLDLLPDRHELKLLNLLPDRHELNPSPWIHTTYRRKRVQSSQLDFTSMSSRWISFGFGSMDFFGADLDGFGS
jgi:hypothetical protein